MAINTFNKFMVAGARDGIQFLRPVPRRLTREEALVLAAHIVAVADDDYGEEGGEFRKILDAIVNA